MFVNIHVYIVSVKKIMLNVSHSISNFVKFLLKINLNYITNLKKSNLVQNFFDGAWQQHVTVATACGGDNCVWW